MCQYQLDTKIRQRHFKERKLQTKLSHEQRHKKLQYQEIRFNTVISLSQESLSQECNLPEFVLFCFVFRKEETGDMGSLNCWWEYKLVNLFQEIAFQNISNNNNNRAISNEPLHTMYSHTGHYITHSCHFIFTTNFKQQFLFYYLPDFKN